jgi:hypothetical protein
VSVHPAQREDRRTASGVDCLIEDAVARVRESVAMKRQPFHFVVANPKSEREKRREVQLARSHTARVNRAKRRSNAQTQAVTEQPARTALPRSVTSADHAYSVQAFAPEHDEEEDEEVLNRAFESLDLPHVQRSASSRSSQTSQTTREFVDQTESLDMVLSPRTLSPVFGAQATGTFALGSSLSNTARAADYCKTRRIHFAADNVSDVPSCRYQCNLAKSSH